MISIFTLLSKMPNTDSYCLFVLFLILYFHLTLFNNNINLQKLRQIFTSFVRENYNI